MIHDGLIFPFSRDSSLFELQSSPSPLHVRVSPCVKKKSKKFASRVLQMKGFLLIFFCFNSLIHFSPSFLYSYIPKRQRPDQKRKVRMRRLVFRNKPAPPLHHRHLALAVVFGPPPRQQELIVIPAMKSSFAVNSIRIHAPRHSCLLMSACDLPWCTLDEIIHHPLRWGLPVTDGFSISPWLRPLLDWTMTTVALYILGFPHHFQVFEASFQFSARSWPKVKSLL